MIFLKKENMDIIEKLNKDDQTLNEMLKFNKRFQFMIHKHAKKIEILREKTEERLQKCTTTEMRDIVIKNTINYLDEYYRTDDDIVFQSEYGKIINDKLKEDVKQLKEDVLNDLRLIDCDKNLNGCLNIVSIVPDTIVPYDETIVTKNDNEIDTIEEKLLEYNLNDITDKTKSSMVLYEEPLITFHDRHHLDHDGYLEEFILELKNSYKNKFGNKYRKDKDEHVYDCVHFKKWKKKELKKYNYTEPIIIRKGGSTKRQYSTLSDNSILSDNSTLSSLKLRSNLKRPQTDSRMSQNVTTINVHNKNSLYTNVNNIYDYIVGTIVEDTILDTIGFKKERLHIDYMMDNIDNIMLLIIQNSTYYDIDDVTYNSTYYDIDDVTYNDDSIKNLTDEEKISLQKLKTLDVERNDKQKQRNIEEEKQRNIEEQKKRRREEEKQTTGGENAITSIRVKMLNDLDHDFKSNFRNDMNAENKNFKKFFNAEIFNELLVSENEFFFNTILDIGYKNMNKFVISKREYFVDTTDDNKQHIEKFKEAMKPITGKVYIVEDMTLSHDVKNPLGIDDSHSTNTNIMDPITQASEDYGHTHKLSNLIYPEIKQHIITNHLNGEKGEDILNNIVTRTIGDICTEFFQEIHEFNLKRFDLKPFQSTEDESFYHFPVKIVFDDDVTIDFNFYAGMFTVKRINLFIWKVMNPKPKSDEENMYKQFLNEGTYKDQKIMNSIHAFYKQLLSAFKQMYDDTTASELSILFIQLMKTLGDHAQVYEMEQLLKGSGNVIFGSKDRIIIAEAIRLDSPVLFTMREINSKFPEYFKFPDDFERYVFNPDDLVFFYQGSPIKNTTMNVQQTLNDIFKITTFDPLELDIRVCRVNGIRNLQDYINTNIFDYLFKLFPIEGYNDIYMKEFVKHFGLLKTLTSINDEKTNIQNILSIIEMFKVFETINNTIQNLLYNPGYISKLKYNLLAIENRIQSFQKIIGSLKKQYIEYTNKIKKSPPSRVSLSRKRKKEDVNIYEINLETAIQNFKSYAENKASQSMVLNSSKDTIIKSLSNVINKRLMKQNKYLEILFQEQNLPNVSPGHTIIATMMNEFLPNFSSINTSIQETIASIYKTISSIS